MVWLELLEFVCLIGIFVTFVGFTVQLARKKDNKSKKEWGVTLLGFSVIFLICITIMPVSEFNEKDEIHRSVVEATESEKQTSTIEQKHIEQSEVEIFAKNNNVSVKLAESLKSVLESMELTDKSRVGIFHYNLSHVYNWKQVEDYADGQRYSAWMDMEHIWYIYVKDDMVVGVRDGHGNIFYSE
ncbi:MAG: hypothetical protein Q4D76_19830 [Oscillospiraceae bacterium]|nr:hypothetical protein [Oscillospiraceae bacterium]